MYERILVALDASPLAELVLPHVQAIAARFGSTVILVRVAPRLSSGDVAASPPQDPTQVHRLEEEAPAGYLTRIAGELRAQGLTVETVELSGDPAHEMTAYARTTGVDLIAMTTHGRSGLQRLLMGSVASEMVRTAPCPVLLVRGTESLARQAKLESVVF